MPPPLEEPPPGSPFTGNFVEPRGSAAAAPAGGRKPVRRARLAARLTRRGRTFTVSGTAPARTLVRVALLRNGGQVAVKRTRATRRGAFRVIFRVRRPGLYRAVVTARSAGSTLTRRTAAARLRR